ncbi:hypothetical protein HYH03_018114 [Edaphochlamys debaryana]|uniref:Uncharacterized protein n=1 Tax=Edaphochlamys debaryana TaxID=47281 RepID=A0A835XF84_9CHLO|nr:hypothetical protein HYH03_018114 [Edaphochlamys debaryana]|eukprot:KAG2482988.1 hypothetical protein HYH03_018114 [Edaphochlamys debaryana]
MVTWRCDFDKSVITANFKRRGWVEDDGDEGDASGWDLWWASVQTVKALFGETTLRLQSHQRINHFPNHFELTRKDLMVKNIKRYQKQMKREGGNPADLDIIPATFVLPQDYMLFAEEFRRSSSAAGGGGSSASSGSGAGGAGAGGPGSGATWIMKPSSRSQGKGIFLINKLSQIKQWSVGSLPPALRSGTDCYVVSRYIDNPLLVGGKKFDMRLYVVVTSFKPLKVHMSRLGFCRFCNVKYSAEVGELRNEFMHLTNVAIQQHGDAYNSHHGNKWPLDHLRLFLEATRGVEAADRLFADIEGVILKSLRAVQPIIQSDRHCFELYGYDVIIDAGLKPWLIEVNASPSLSTTTQADRLLKHRVISDTLDIISPPDWLAMTDPAALPPDMRCVDPATYPFREVVGSMRLICDESEEYARFKAAQAARATLAAAAAAAGSFGSHGPGAYGGSGGYGGGEPGMPWGGGSGGAGGGGGALPPRPVRHQSARPYGSGGADGGGGGLLRASSVGASAAAAAAAGGGGGAGGGRFSGTGAGGGQGQWEPARPLRSSATADGSYGGGGSRPRSAV